MNDIRNTALEICSIISRLAQDPSCGGKILGLNAWLDSIYTGTAVTPDKKSYSLTSRPEDYVGDYEHDEKVYVENMTFPCCSITRTSSSIVFECIDPADAQKTRCMTVAQAADDISHVDMDEIQKAYIRVKTYNLKKSTYSTIKECDPGDVVDEQSSSKMKMAVIHSLDLDTPLDLDYTDSIDNLAQEQCDDQIMYSESMRRLGSRFFGESFDQFHEYEIQFEAYPENEVTVIEVAGTTVEDAVKSFNEEFADMFPDSKVVKIKSITCDGNLVPEKIIDKLNASFVDECDGAAAGGDAGAAVGAADAGAAAVDAQTEDTAAEMVGTTTTDVLGKCEPGKGYMGKDNFYIPVRAKVPLHRWEAANGGSKRKKDKKGKPKKYAYEKGAKVVVSMFEDENIVLTEGKHWPVDYIKTAYNIIKQSVLGQQSWYKDEYIKQDINSIVDEFMPLSHKNSNLGFFATVIRWFVEYAGSSSQRYQEFIERKLNDIIKALLKIRVDKSYDSRADEIKKMSFSSFEKLMDEVNSKTSNGSTQVSKADAEYEVTPIYSYEELHKKYGGNKTGYKGDSEWCHTNGKSTYESWTKNGTQMFFVIKQKGWQNIKPPDPKTTDCYDEYGMSLIAILVDVKTNKLLNSTSRWNHIILPKSGAADTMFESWQQLNTSIGIDVKSICENEIKDIKDKLEKESQNANAEVEKILRNVDVIRSKAIPRRLRELITSIVIPDNVTNIMDYAFAGCSSLTSVTIPDSVTSIGAFAFSNCSSLTSVKIPNSMTSIGYHAFSNCTGLTSVTIPDSVTSIGAFAFAYCISLTSMTIPDSVTSIEDYAFSNCSRLASMTIPDSVTNIEDYAFYNCINLTSVTIPDSVTSIGAYAFYNCSRLASVTIPDSVTSIGGRAFIYCSGLTSVTIPNSVISIGYHAFSYCSGLASVTFKNKTYEEVKSMKWYPWGIKDTHIIHAEDLVDESKHDAMIHFQAHMLDECFDK